MGVRSLPTEQRPSSIEACQVDFSVRSKATSKELDEIGYGGKLSSSTPN